MKAGKKAVESLRKKGLVRVVVMWKYVGRVSKKRKIPEKVLKERYTYVFLTAEGRRLAESLK